MVAPAPLPLLPSGRAATRAEIAALRPGRPGATRDDTPHLLLSATRTGDGLRILLARNCPAATVLQYSRPDQRPDHWADLEDLAPRGRNFELKADLPAGTRIRARISGTHTAIVHVVDPDLATRRSSSGNEQRRHAPGFDEIFAIPDALEELFRLHEQLVATPAADHAATSGTPTSGARGAGDLESYTVGDWRDYLDALHRHRRPGNHGVAHWGSFHPSSRAAAGAPIDWDDPDLEETPEALDHDGVEHIADKVSATNSDFEIAEAHRARYRKAVTAPPAEDEPLEQAYLRLRALLQVIAAGAWRIGDDSWVEPLLKRLQRMPDAYESASEQARRSLEPYLSSAAAIALTVAARQVDECGAAGECPSCKVSHAMRHRQGERERSDRKRTGMIVCPRPALR